VNELFTDYSQTAVASSKQRFNEDTQNKKVCFTIDDYYQPRNYVAKILTHQAVIPLLQQYFLTKAVVIGTHRRHYFYLDMHQKAFGGRAPPGPAGGAIALPQTS